MLKRGWLINAALGEPAGKPAEKAPGISDELRRDIDRRATLISMAGIPYEEIGPELMAELEAKLPEHLREKKEDEE